MQTLLYETIVPQDLKIDASYNVILSILLMLADPICQLGTSNFIVNIR